MAIQYGDTADSLTDKQQGGDETLSGPAGEENSLYGDAGMAITDHARGGNDSLVGGTDSDNLLRGDAQELSGKAEGGNDSLTGGDLTPDAVAFPPTTDLANVLWGDATTLSGFAKGGNDVLIGGDNFGVLELRNALTGDGRMFDHATGGDDTLIGGNSYGAHVLNLYAGDGDEMSDQANGGNDVLIAGTALFDGGVTNSMVGDGTFASGHPKGGADAFVFHDNGSMTVGTDNLIFDFSQSQHDKIQFIGVAGVAVFADLTFDTTTEPGTTIIHAGADAVKLVGFTDTLTEHDFLFG